MGIDEIVVTLGGILTIAFIFWFFFMKKENAVTASDLIEVIVDGGYSPETINVQAGNELTLQFIRKDASPCLEEVVFSDFGIRRYLPLNERVEVKIKPKDKKSYSFACGMNMYRGKIIAA